MLEAEKGKQLIWVDRSSHLFHPEDAALIEQYLINELKYVDYDD